MSIRQPCVRGAYQHAQTLRMCLAQELQGLSFLRVGAPGPLKGKSHVQVQKRVVQLVRTCPEVRPCHQDYNVRAPNSP